MVHDWSMKLACEVALIGRILAEESDLVLVLRTTLQSVVSICEGEAGTLEVKSSADTDLALRISTAGVTSSHAFPPACLEQVVRTGRHLAPPELDALSDSEDLCNDFGPLCALCLRCPGRILGAMVVRMKGGQPVDAAQWAALKVIACFISLRLANVGDAALAAGLRAQRSRTEELEAQSRRRRASRLGGTILPDAFASMIGCSEALLNLFDKIKRAAKADSVVLITGESGSGKELVAEAVHQLARPGKPFVTVNAASLRGELGLSELVGHVKGAFTGSTSEHAGLFLRADGGVLFMDEIENLPKQGQEDLLRLLETGLVRPVGGERDQKVTVLFVCASNRNLREMVDLGEFREDLFRRLEDAVVTVPSLAERPEDIPALVLHWLSKGEKQCVMHPGAWARLLAESWKGNIRELKNFVCALMRRCEGEILDRHIAEELADRGRQPDIIPPSLASLLKEEARLERLVLVVAFQICGGNVEEAARLLGMSESGYRKRLKTLEVNLPRRTKVRKPLEISREEKL